MSLIHLTPFVLPLHPQLVNMCSSDGQRMFDAAVVGSLLAGGPLVAILGVAYNLFVLGPTSLLGSAVFILFYPAMVSSCGDHMSL